MKQIMMRAEFKKMNDDMLKMMYDYQRINSVNGNCVTNCQYLYDQIHDVHFIDVKFKPVIATGTRKRITNRHIELDHYSIVHLVLVVNDGFMEQIVDPSYEVVSLEDLKYYTTIKDWKNNHPKKDFVDKKGITDFLDFVKIAQQMNDGQFCVTNREWYDGQADYIRDEVHKYPMILSCLRKNTNHQV